MTTTRTNDISSADAHLSRAFAPRSCGPQGSSGHHFRSRHWAPFLATQPTVNIEETADAYLLTLYAGGLDKSGFRVSALGDVLSIRYVGSPDASDSRRFTRREQRHDNFEREFALNSRVQIDAIAANYSEGVLTVCLPKTLEAMQPEHQVPVQ